MKNTIKKASDYIISQYNANSYSTCFDNSDNMKYLTIGLKSEAGELYDPLKKIYRESVGVNEVYFSAEIIKSLVLEIGDCFWYIVNIARHLNLIDECFAGISNHLDHKFSISINYYLERQILNLDLSNNDIFEENIDKLESVFDFIMAEALSFKNAYKEGFSFLSKKQLVHKIQSIYVYLLLICMMISSDPVYVMKQNTAKLHDRKKRNVINGSGGYR